MASSDTECGGLLERLKRGDEPALAQLFSCFRARLWRIVHFRLHERLRSRVDAEDILQEAYLNAAQRVHHFEGDSMTAVFVWLRMIVAQTLVDVHRRHMGAQMRDAGREVSIDGCRYPEATSTSIAIQLAGDWTSPSQAAMRAEVSRQLADALEAVDPIDREVLALRHFEELTNSEVAAVLGITQKAASIRYVRALRRLKKILATMPAFSDSSHGPDRPSRDAEGKTHE